MKITKTKIKSLIGLSLLSGGLGGCGMGTWETAPNQYKCTDEQMAKVLQQTKDAIAIDKENYPKYWYGAAIMRNCEKLP